MTVFTEAFFSIQAIRQLSNQDVLHVTVCSRDQTSSMAL
jgi:hypothetical protein